MAEDNLRAGRTVIADGVNPWPLTGGAWHSVAERAGVRDRGPACAGTTSDTVHFRGSLLAEVSALIVLRHAA
jgi:hypothetical protein